MATRHQLTGEMSLVVQFRIGLSNDVLGFFNCRQIFNVIGDLVIGHFPIRCFDETILIGSCVQSQGVDQTNVRTFGRFDRADTTIVRWVYVAHFEASAFTRQTTRTQSRNTALVRNF